MEGQYDFGTEMHDRSAGKTNAPAADAAAQSAAGGRLFAEEKSEFVSGEPLNRQARTMPAHRHAAVGVKTKQAAPSPPGGSVLSAAVSYAALALACLILWKPTIVVAFPGLLYTKDLSTVYVHEACVPGSTATILVFCILEVLVAGVLLKRFVLPKWFQNPPRAAQFEPQNKSNNAKSSCDEVVPSSTSDLEDEAAKRDRATAKSAWDGFGADKQNRLTGFANKILVRLSCAVQVGLLCGRYLDFDQGMAFMAGDGSSISRQPHETTGTTSNTVPTTPPPSVRQAGFVTDYVKHGKLTTCAAAGMRLEDAVGIRAWMFSRYNLVAVMLWELCFIPHLGLDAWLHHLFVILGVALTLDEHFQVDDESTMPLRVDAGQRAASTCDNSSKRAVVLEVIGYCLTLGACLAAVVELGVLGYHLNANNPRRQFYYMLQSIVTQVLVVVLFFAALPAYSILRHFDNLHSRCAFGMTALIVFLVFVELSMISTKFSVLRHIRRKMLKLGEEKKNQ